MSEIIRLTSSTSEPFHVATDTRLEIALPSTTAARAAGIDSDILEGCCLNEVLLAIPELNVAEPVCDLDGEGVGGIGGANSDTEMSLFNSLELA